MNNIKRQNFNIFSFKIRMKHKFTLSTNRNILKKSKCQQYFLCFIVCILESSQGTYLWRSSIQLPLQFTVILIIMKIMILRGLIMLCYDLWTITLWFWFPRNSICTILIIVTRNDKILFVATMFLLTFHSIYLVITDFSKIFIYFTVL